MVKITVFFVFSALSCLVSAAPVLEKRIAQNTIDSKTLWEQACVSLTRPVLGNHLTNTPTD